MNKKKLPKTNQQLQELNKTLSKNPAIFHLLSKRGKEIYYPKKGLLAQGKEAKGKKINATIGIAMEDDGTPMRLKSIASKISLEPKQIFPYTDSFGQEELRNLWQKKMIYENPSLKTTITKPLITAGITHALSIAGYLFVDEKDELILPDLYWGNYQLIFQNTYGAKFVTYKTFKNNQNQLDLDSFKTALSNKKNKKIILLNFPNNPTGYTPTKNEAEEIVNILVSRVKKGEKIAVICDDAYYGLFYDQQSCKESIFSLLASAHENILAIKADGATKEEFAWGLRVGAITFGNKGMTEEICIALENKTAGAIRATVSNVSTLSQSLILQALNSPSHRIEKSDKFKILQERFNEVKKVLMDKKYNKYFTPLPFNSGYFMCVKLASGLDSEKIRQRLLNHYDTGVIALPNMLRISYASIAKDKIRVLFENIYRVCEEER